MTKEEIGNIIKRYPYISDAINKDLRRAEFYIGNRKFVIDITEDIKSVYEIIKIIHKGEQNVLIKRIIKYIIEGKPDIYILQHIPYSKNAYYSRKQAFIEKVYNCCIACSLVSFEEVLEENIAQ